MKRPARAIPSGGCLLRIRLVGIARKYNGMQDPPDNLTPKQVRALASLLAGRPIETTATDIGVNPSTVHRWLSEPAFKAALDSGRLAAAELGLDLMLSLVRNAVAVQLDHLRPGTPAHLRQRASEFVITHALAWIELHELKARVDALEARREPDL